MQCFVGLCECFSAFALLILCQDACKAIPLTFGMPKFPRKPFCIACPSWIWR